MNEEFHVAITGANGFIGRHTVTAAVNRGYRVTAILRDKGRVDPEWRKNAKISGAEIDLSAPSAITRLSSALEGVDAVIHTAAAMSGNDRFHEENTLKPLRAVLKAMISRPCGPPRLVLVSSLAVYDVDTLARGQTLDERCPLVIDAKSRDAYCRSKLVQEALALDVAARHGVELRIMRPGAVFGPGRLWNGHIGQALGPLVVQLEKLGEVPVSFVVHCAEALALAARHSVDHDDRTGKHENGCVEIINVVDDDLPDRDRYMAALRQSGWPRCVLPASWRPLAAAASAVSSLGQNVSGRMPGLLRPAIISSRMKPITYGNKRLHERLLWKPFMSFEQAMTLSVARQSMENVYARAG